MPHRFVTSQCNRNSDGGSASQSVSLNRFSTTALNPQQLPRSHHLPAPARRKEEWDAAATCGPISGRSAADFRSNGTQQDYNHPAYLPMIAPRHRSGADEIEFYGQGRSRLGTTDISLQEFRGTTVFLTGRLDLCLALGICGRRCHWWHTIGVLPNMRLA